MNRTSTIRAVAATLLLMAVLYMFVSPVFQVPQSALRSHQQAQELVLMLVAFATVLSGFVAPTLVESKLVSKRHRDGPTTAYFEENRPLIC